MKVKEKVVQEGNNYLKCPSCYDGIVRVSVPYEDYQAMRAWRESRSIPARCSNGHHVMLRIRADRGPAMIEPSRHLQWVDST